MNKYARKASSKTTINEFLKASYTKEVDTPSFVKETTETEFSNMKVSEFQKFKPQHIDDDSSPCRQMTASSSYAIPQKAPLKLLQESKKDKFEIIKENLSTTNFSKFAGDKKIKKAKSSIKKKLEQIR